MSRTVLAASPAAALPDLRSAAERTARLLAAVALVIAFYVVFFGGFALYFAARVLCEPARRIAIRRQFGQWTRPAAPELLFVPSEGRRA